MKSSFFILAAAFIFSAAVNAGDIVAQSYPISSVLALSAGGDIEVDITQGDTESLRVETTPEMMRRLKVDLTGHMLTLGLKNGNGNGNFFNWFNNDDDQVKFILQIKALNLLDLSGAAEASVGDYRGEELLVKNSGAAQTHFTGLHVNDLAIESSGAANTEIQILNSQNVNVGLSGASNFIVKKSSVAGQLIVEASGASSFHGKPLSVTEADVRASGASNIEVRATEKLKAGASGASNIDYYGSAKVSSDSSGASHINGHQ